MREPQSRVIDGRKFVVTPLPAGIAVKALARLSNALGPAIANVVSIKGLESIVLDALGSMLERLDGENLESLCKIFASTSSAESATKPGEMISLGVAFDMYFAGDMAALAEWFAFCVEVNYAGFFHVVRDRLAKRVASVPTATSTSVSPQA